MINYSKGGKEMIKVRVSYMWAYLHVVNELKEDKGLLEGFSRVTDGYGLDTKDIVQMYLKDIEQCVKRGTEGEYYSFGGWFREKKQGIIFNAGERKVEDVEIRKEKETVEYMI